MEVLVEPHPELRLAAFVTELPDELARLSSPPWLRELLRAEAPAPITGGETIRTGVRDLLRFGGYKPTGRGKPASEYLTRAAAEGKLSSINLIVDLCNAVSLHSGLPISVVDLSRATPPLRVGLAGPDTRYVFNASGQEIRVDGLLCLHDAEGACANAVKDAQRTKTGDSTRRTMSLIWGRRSLEEHTVQAELWYRELTARTGATTEDVAQTAVESGQGGGG